MRQREIAAVFSCGISAGIGSKTVPTHTTSTDQYTYDPALRAIQQMYAYGLYGKSGMNAFQPPPAAPPGPPVNPTGPVNPNKPPTGGPILDAGPGNNNAGPPGTNPVTPDRPTPTFGPDTPPGGPTDGYTPPGGTNRDAWGGPRGGPGGPNEGLRLPGGYGHSMFAESSAAAPQAGGSQVMGTNAPAGPHGVKWVGSSHDQGDLAGGPLGLQYPGLLSQDPQTFYDAAKQALADPNYAAAVPDYAKSIIQSGGTAQQLAQDPGFQQNAGMTGEQWGKSIGDYNNQQRSNAAGPDLRAQQADFQRKRFESSGLTADQWIKSGEDPAATQNASANGENTLAANPSTGGAYGVGPEVSQAAGGRMPVTPGPTRPPTTVPPPQGTPYVPPPDQYNIPPPTTSTYGIPPQSDPNGDPVLDWGTNGAAGNRDLTGAAAFASARDMYAHPDLDPSVQNAIAQQGMNATRASFAGQQGQADRHRAVTGNSAGYAAQTAQAGRNEAGAYGMQARQNTIDFEKEKQRRKEAAQGQMQNLYGTESQYNLGLLGGLAGASGKLAGQTSTGKVTTEQPVVTI